MNNKRNMFCANLCAGRILIYQDFNKKVAQFSWSSRSFSVNVQKLDTFSQPTIIELILNRQDEVEKDEDEQRHKNE